MPTYEIQSGGKTYEIEAPDETTAVGALKQGGHKGMILPFSADAKGNVSFDSDAGVLGLAKGFWNAAKLPGDVATGKAPVTLPTISDDPARPDYAGNASPVTGRVLNPDVVKRTQDLAIMATPTVPKAGPEVAARAGGPPTVDELKAASSTGYDAARNMGVDIKPEAVTSMGGSLAATLERDGINAELAPKTFSILNKLQSAPEGSVATVGNLDTVRRTLGNAAKDFANPTEQLAAKRAQQYLDDYLSRVPQSDVLAGDALQASKSLSEARGNYAAAMRAEKIQDAAGAADLSAAAANSGLNIGNANRQKFKSVLLSDKQSAGFSPEELAQIERVVRGTKTGNALRYTGNILGAGGGLGQAVASGVSGATGAAVGGLPGAAVGAAAPPIIGNIARVLANKSVERQVNILDELVRSRSPLAAEMAAEAPAVVEQLARKTSSPIVRALLQSYTNRQ